MANKWDYMSLKQKNSESDSAQHASFNITDVLAIEDEIIKVNVPDSAAMSFTNTSKPQITSVHNNNLQNNLHGNDTSIPEEAPLARMEFDDEDDREVVNRPYPGVDDGFFAENDKDESRTNNPHEGNSGHPDVEFIPKSRDPESEQVIPHTPKLTPRLGPDGEQSPPEEQPSSKGLPSPRFPLPRDFPDFHAFKPHFGDEEIGTQGTETIPDINVYQHKKTLAQGMMDLALFSANANQLRYVLENFGKSHPYSIPSLVLISLSLILQVVIGAGLVWNATFNIKDEKALCVANKVNNMTTIGVFFVTVINVFISAFGITTNSTI